MKKFLALLMAAAMTFSLAACGSSSSSDTSGSGSSSGSASSAAASDLKVGVILIGDENEGYSYAHIEGVEQAKETLGLSDDQIIYKYNIPEDETCYDTAIDLVEQGCDIIFANSFSHESYILQAASEPEQWQRPPVWTISATTSPASMSPAMSPA